MDRTAAIADHNGVRDESDPGAEIDRRKARAIRIDLVGAGLRSSEGRPEGRKVIAG
jgi:hypothetical protein